MELGKRAAAAGDEDYARIEAVGGSMRCRGLARSGSRLLGRCLHGLSVVLPLHSGSHCIGVLRQCCTMPCLPPPAGSDRGDRGVCRLAVRDGHQQVWVRAAAHSQGPLHVAGCNAFRLWPDAKLRPLSVGCSVVVCCCCCCLPLPVLSNAACAPSLSAFTIPCTPVQLVCSAAPAVRAGGPRRGAAPGQETGSGARACSG